MGAVNEVNQGKAIQREKCCHSGLWSNVEEIKMLNCFTLRTPPHPPPPPRYPSQIILETITVINLKSRAGSAVILPADAGIEIPSPWRDSFWRGSHNTVLSNPPSPHSPEPLPDSNYLAKPCNAKHSAGMNDSRARGLTKIAEKITSLICVFDGLGWFAVQSNVK